ncbi:flagellar biosynthesis anti-sigma factor FlgM [Desulfonatronospira sp.]|uniref:flagellar biosynthesis anti-sigma factor FlgM n=1 Tax=Desulfonatronospira sp. TaxID=1962951 RepID=UPI0025B92423|nr:flagellar biosynthesis anti-sigma factor FlgM [Desulfonatronospira sp.]
MQIKGFPTGIQTYEQSRTDKTRADKEARKSSLQGQSGDKVTLSQGAKLHHAAMQAAVDSDEVRMEKVQDLRERVADGSYQLDARKTAEKMIREDLENWMGRSINE